MNREEAIYYLKSSGMSDEQIKSVIDAFTCDDCISREAVIKMFGEVHPMDYNTQAYITNIQNLPSITPQQTNKIEESNYSKEQYEADLQGAYDCGYNCGYTDAMIDIAESKKV